MNVLKITQTNKCYILEFNEQRLILLNHKALDWHLKKRVGFDHVARKSIYSALSHEPTVSINLDDVFGKVA